VRGLVTLIVAAVGSLCLMAILIGMDVGDDNSDETVRVSTWADDTCGAVGAWEGQIQVIADGVRTANAAVRQNDGGSGDSVEWTFFVRTAITRTIQATDLTLQEGLKRAGIPDVEEGEQASLILRGWAQETKDGLRSARATLEREADSTTAAIEAIGYAASVLSQSQVVGREAFEEVAALDSELENALTESDRCTDLRADRP
jgi:hypothetical protein